MYIAIMSTCVWVLKQNISSHIHIMIWQSERATTKVTSVKNTYFHQFFLSRSFDVCTLLRKRSIHFSQNKARSRCFYNVHTTAHFKYQQITFFSSFCFNFFVISSLWFFGLFLSIIVRVNGKQSWNVLLDKTFLHVRECMADTTFLLFNFMINIILVIWINST